MNRRLALAALACLCTLNVAVPCAIASTLPERIETLEHRTARCVSPPPSVNCEVSAVARVGDQLILANDKPVPNSGGEALFSLGLADGRLTGTPSYLPGDALRQADKYEALTTSLDGKYVIAATAFNKAGTDENPGADALNTLLYWPVGNSGSAKVLQPSARKGVTSSLALRKQISEAIGAPYFQVEGVTIAPRAAHPDGQLLLGIRKYGESSANSEFAFVLLSAPIAFEKGELELLDTFKKIPMPPLPDSGHALGLSGIEYDRYNEDRLYAVTSFEEDTLDASGNKTGSVIGGFLWVLPFTDGLPGTPRLVKRADGSPLQFSNKPEGVEVLDETHLLVVHDDDRVDVNTSENGIKRGDSEFAYSVITFPESAP